MRLSFIVYSQSDTKQNVSYLIYTSYFSMMVMNMLPHSYKNTKTGQSKYKPRHKSSFFFRKKPLEHFPHSDPSFLEHSSQFWSLLLQSSGNKSNKNVLFENHVLIVIFCRLNNLRTLIHLAGVFLTAYSVSQLRIGFVSMGLYYMR